MTIYYRGFHTYFVLNIKLREIFYNIKTNGNKTIYCTFVLPFRRGNDIKVEPFKYNE